ncbi:MAG TPA: hypothetical protein PKW76_13795 [bacterium]|nr:hypothetical protein [bacterium]HPG46745.1 hypothetical protein [bacterium]HPM98925.1 hypothetical protein [bacterium]
MLKKVANGGDDKGCLLHLSSPDQQLESDKCKKEANKNAKIPLWQPIQKTFGKISAEKRNRNAEQKGGQQFSIQLRSARNITRNPGNVNEQSDYAGGKNVDLLGQIKSGEKSAANRAADAKKTGEKAGQQTAKYRRGVCLGQRPIVLEE